MIPDQTTILGTITTKVFLTDDDIATFICPKCGRTKNQDVSKYKQITKAVRIKCKCPCGHSHIVILERRKFKRRKTRIPGEYIWGKLKKRDKMIIKDLSCIGLRFEQIEVRDIKVGDTLTVEFKLDETDDSTLIKKEVIVKNVSGRDIGAAFSSLDPEDFCLMSEYADIS